MDFDAAGLLKFLEEYNHVPDDGLYIFSTECVENSEWTVVSDAPGSEVAPKSNGKGPPVPGGKGPPVPRGKGPPVPGGKGPPVPGGKGPPVPGGKGPPIPGGKGKGKGPTPAPPFGRRLPWKSIGGDALENSIFAEIQNAGNNVLDVLCMENLFKPKEPTKGKGSKGTPPPGKIGLGGKGKGPNVKSDSTTIFDAKKAQNITIILRNYGVGTPEQWVQRCLALHRMDTRGWAPETLEHLMECLVPQLEDFKKELLQFDGDVTKLRDIERQCIALVRVPRLEQRVSIMIFAESMERTAETVSEKIDLYVKASNQVRSSFSLRKIFRTILSLGNYLNTGMTDTQCNGHLVKGFQLESLLKLSDFKSSQHNELSALHCVVVHLLQQVQSEREQGDNESPPALWIENLKGELKHVEEIGKGKVIPMSRINDMITLFGKSVSLIKSELDEHMEEYEEHSTYLSELYEFTNDKLNKLQVEMDDACELVDGLLDFFASAKDAKHCYESFGKFFETLWKFTLELDNAWKEVLNNPKKLGKFLPSDTYDFLEDSKKETSGERGDSSSANGAAPPRKSVRAAGTSTIRRRKPAAALAD